MFNAADIHARVRQQSFVPLRIMTSSGQHYDVYHPDLVLVGRRDVTIGQPCAENPTIYDQVNRVAIFHVTDMQDLPTPAAPAGSNGAAD